jgi:hypothetical protein
MVDPTSLLQYLRKLQTDVAGAITWVEGHKTPFLIEAPIHVGPHIGSHGAGCVAPPSIAIDDQIAVEVLWVVEEAMPSS